MQDIVFYAAVLCETQGIVRDSANARNQSAPVLVLGVSACLKMRLFAACNVATPYPVASCSGISDWIWRMDADFERDTPSKLVADADGIFVHTVTDTVDGKTVNFTEFVIPISNMNTQELTTWIGSERKRSGLTGELIGYDSAGNAVFVLQIDDFTVSNRVGGLGDPTAIEQEVATRSQTAQMIQAAVSASAATKQDKLTSANAGTNISIDANGVISNTYSLPSATTGSRGGVMLATTAETISGSNATKAITPATFLSALSGNDQIIAKTAIQAFQPITELGSASTVSLKSGGAYRLFAVSGNHYLTVTDVPADKYGMDAHMELFIGNTSLIHVYDPLILMDALIPNAVNDCVIKFRDGTARMFVEDHAYGYVVTVAGGTDGTDFGGSLYRGLTEADNSYISFANSLNGQTVILPETATINRAVNIVGNGYTQTVISGGIFCASKTTFSNLGMNGVSVLGGTATLGDVFIPSGATVAVSGGGLAVEKVTGDGGTIDLGGTRVSTIAAGTAVATGCTFSGGNGTAPIFRATVSGKINLDDCRITGQKLSVGNNAGLSVDGGGSAYLSGCTIDNNSGYNGAGIYIGSGGSITIDSCVVSGNSASTGFKDIQCVAGGIVTLAGTNTLGVCGTDGGAYVIAGGTTTLDILKMRNSSGTVTISSGAIIDLTGNSNPTPINPGGGVTFAPGGATVYPSAGSASAYSFEGSALALTNTNAVTVDRNFPSHASGCSITFTNVAAPVAAAGGSSSVLSNCLLYTEVSSMYITGFGNSGTLVLGGTVSVNAQLIGANAAATANLTLLDGATLDMTGVSGAFPVQCQSGTLTVGSNCTFITSGGTSVLLNNGAHTKCSVSAEGNMLCAIYTPNYYAKIQNFVSCTSSAFISSGTIIDLTGNTNSVPIKAADGVTFAPGGATVYPSTGQASAYMLGGMTVPQIGNTNVVNLNSSNITVSAGGSAIISGAVFAGGSASSGGAFLLDRATLAMSDTTISGCSASSGGAMFLARGSVLSAARVAFLDNQAATFYHINIENSDAEFSSCTQSGGAAGALYIQAVGAGSSATATITDCEFSSLIKVNAAATVLNIAGTNTLATVNGAGSVTISSGASINLTSSIAPGGGITLYGGHYEAPTTIIGSGGVSRTFEDLEIKGSTINNAGLIFGATIYSNEGDDHEVRYTEDGGVTSSSVFISGQTAFAVPGGLMQVLNT